MNRTVLAGILLASAVALTACGGKGATTGPLPVASGGSDGGGTGSGGTGTPGGGSPGGSAAGERAPFVPDRSSAARDAGPGGNYLDVNGFPLHQIVSGGVSRDGIPALTDPRFVEAQSSEAGYLSDGDIVMGVVLNGEAKAYPHNIGWHHEIVNDVVGGAPIIATFCPLTGTGLVFSGEDDSGERITVGVSGLLFNNNLIMYDRRDGETLYPQMIHRAVEGPGKGRGLELLPVVEATWGFWKKLQPHTLVVSDQTGIYSSGRYQTYPYNLPGEGDYRFGHEFIMFPVIPALSENGAGNLFQAKELTLGVRFGEIAKAYPFPLLGAGGVINDRVADTDLLVVHYGEEGLAVPYRRTVRDGAADRALTFDRVATLTPPHPFMLKDRETGTIWNLRGEAERGPMAGKQLQQLPAHNGFWFAWATFWQNTGVY